MADLLVTGLIVDGGGAPAFPGFVAVGGGRIERVGREGEPEPEAAERIGGPVVCPGFIDAHSHSDLVPFVEPWMESALRQGVTTVIVGNCGSSAAPPAGAGEMARDTGICPGDVDLGWRSFGEYLERLDACRPAVNIASLVGHGAIRMQVMGVDRRPPTTGELSSMRRLIAEAMDAGAVGMSTGLVYIPGMYADTGELAALASGLARYGGIYASHIRAEGELAFDAVAEAVEIGRHAGVPTHVSHLKLEGGLVWGRADELLGAIHGARDEGVDVTADQYPYTAWASVLLSLLPPWAPPAELPRLLEDPAERARLVRAMENGEPRWQSSVKGVGWDRIILTSHAGESRYLGRSVAEIAAERDEEPALTALALLVDDPDTGAVGHAMRDDDVRAILADPDVMVGSDSTAMPPSSPLAFPVHPRRYGTFPRVLERSLGDGLLSLEAVVRKMTSLPAGRFGLSDRGRITPGAAADLVILDPDRVRDVATFEDPHRFPEGIHLVVVNGRIAWAAEGGNRERSGRVLRGTAGAALR